MSDLERVLGPSGRLSLVSGAYEDRPAQREMARKVLDAIAKSRHLVVEAGTGTGKTLAYLVPAILSGRKTVVSTATRALQEQIVQRDLPLLSDRIGLRFEAACLKGRANYLCRRRKALFDSQPLFPFREDARIYEVVRDWAHETAGGDKAEVTGVPEDWPTWREITSSTESCVGQRCEYAPECFVTAARAKAAAADLVVVNHHLFFADLALKASSAGEVAGAEVIPAYDAVIFDEAHAVEDIATAFFGFSISNYKIRDLARDTAKSARVRDGGGALGEAAARLDERSERFFSALGLREGRERLRPASLEQADEDLSLLQEALTLLAAAAGKAEDEEDLASLERRAREMGCTLELVSDLEAPGLVHWTEVRGGGVYLHASPLDTAGEIRRHLLRKVGCVFTSATLASGGDTRFFQDRIGLSEDGVQSFDVEVAILPSPFDFERQAALYVPKAFPLPNDAEFPLAVAREVARLCELTGARAFVLCTSFRNMEAIHAWLDDELRWPVLKQGDAPKSALLNEFRERPSVLVATQSFWEGVDVPGDALSLVVMDKLPFAPPGDPLLAARRDAMEARGRNAFFELQVPQAAVSLKQGFGRLVRTAYDRGIVAVCDTRLAEKSYRRHFLKTLPPCPRFRELDDLSDWWSAHG